MRWLTLKTLLGWVRVRGRQRGREAEPTQRYKLWEGWKDGWIDSNVIGIQFQDGQCGLDGERDEVNTDVY